MNCHEYNAQIFIGNENYYLSADGHLMPARKGQKPPDLKYFNATGCIPRERRLGLVEGTRQRRRSGRARARDE
jgi:hypothetical protein